MQTPDKISLTVIKSKDFNLNSYFIFIDIFIKN